MAAPKVILVPVDFSESSDRVVAEAKELAARLGAKPVLMHAYHLPPYAYPGLNPAIVAKLREDVASAAEQSLAELSKRTGVAETLLREGEPKDEILSAARDVSADLIVMGTEGRRGLSRFFLGSVAEGVVRESPIPVLTIRRPPGT